MHLSKDQIKLDREYGDLAENDPTLYLLLEQVTMNKEYNAVKEFRSITKNSSTKGYDRYAAKTDLQGLPKPDFTEVRNYSKVTADILNYLSKSTTPL